MRTVLVLKKRKKEKKSHAEFPQGSLLLMHTHSNSSLEQVGGIHVR